MKKFLVFFLLLVLTFVGFACKKEDEKKDVLPKSIQIKCDETTLEVGDTLSARATITPSDATNKNVVWSTSDSSIATVKSGVISGISAGSVTITASCEADKNIKDSITITVTEGKEPTVKPQPTVKPTEGGETITSIDINFDTDVFVIDNSFVLTAELTMSDPTSENYDLAWESSDEAIATIEVESETRVTLNCLAVGTVKITVTDAVSELSCELEITVVDHPELTGIKLSNDREVQMPDTCVIAAFPEPAYALFEVTWASSDETIATIDANGKVTPLQAGEVTITATTTEGFTATCKVTVLPPFSDNPESVVITTGYEEVYVGYSVRFAAQVNPAGVNQGVTWTSNNEKVGTIDAQGEFTALSIGTTRIRATSIADTGVCSAYFVVKVVEVPVTNIPDLKGYNIVIMNAESAVHDLDPFNEKYAGLDKTYKQEAWREIESKYNCTISIEPYPVEAPWGTARINWIKTNAENNSSACDFGVIEPTWVNYLCSSTFSSLVDCTPFFGKYGFNQIEAATKDACTYGGKFYALATGLTPRTYPYWGLFYNVKLIERLNLESPAKLFNDGEWTYSKFLAYCTAAKAVMEEDEYAIGGAVSLCWWGMVNAAGVKLADTIDLRINIKHQYSYEALTTLQQIYANGAWDPVNITTTDQSVTCFQEGKAIFQPGEYWFIRSDSRFPGDLWGDDTRYGYVPYPYPDSISKDQTRTNLTGNSQIVMMNNKSHPSGVEYEGIYQAAVDMYLTTVKKMEADPLFDKEDVLTNSLKSRVDDPESIDATLYFTSEKTIFDPYFGGSTEGIQSYDGGETVEALKAIIIGGDIAENLEAIYNEMDTKLKSLYSN